MNVKVATQRSQGFQQADDRHQNTYMSVLYRSGPRLAGEELNSIRKSLFLFVKLPIVIWDLMYLLINVLIAFYWLA